MLHKFRRWLRRQMNKTIAPVRRRNAGLQLELLENRLAPTVSGFSTITNWVGTGSNQAALVVDFHNGQAGDSVVFGYRWDGAASGEDMLKAVAVANTGLYATLYHFSFGDAVFGLGLDRNDGQLNLSPSLPTTFVSGVAMLPNSSDGNAARAAVDSADFYVEDPFVNGYWSYWTSTSIAGDWTSSFVGAGDRTLTNGDVDGWSYAVGFGDIAPSDPVNPNTHPAITTAPTISVAEGNTAVTTVNALDPDAGQTLTYSIAGGADASKFTIVPATGALSFVTAPTFVTGGDNIYDVIVKATDDATPSAFDTLALEVNVTDVRVNFADIESWVGTGSNKAALVVDFHNGQAGDSVVFGYRWDGTASGEDMLKAIAAANTGLYATMFHFSFGDAVFGFGLDRNDGQLNLSPALPTPFVSGVAMLPSSSDGNAARAAVDSADFYLEDPFVNGYWSYWTSTSIADDWTSSFVGAGDRALANGDVDGWSYAVGFGDIAPSDPVNPNTHPAITTAPTISVAEGNTPVTTVHAIDPDAGQTLTYSIAGGADASKFTIVPATGALSFITAPTFVAGGDNVYDVIVKATDDATPSALDTLALTVTVTDVRVDFADIETWIGTGSNQAALVVDFHNGQAGDSVVFGYRWDGAASGEDMLKAVTAANTGLYATMFHFSFGDAVFGFGLDRNDGQLNLSPALPTSFVSGVAMLPNSSDGNAARAAVDSADFYVEDPFVNGYWSYWTSTSIAGDWTSSFVGAGDRTLTNGDVDGWSYAIGFGDIAPSDPVNPNTPPAITTAPAISVAEGNTAVTTVNVLDPDAGQTLTYSIAGGADASKFTIVPATGALSFITAPTFVAGGDNVYDVIVKATDDATPSAFDTLALTVTVTDVRVNFADIESWVGTGSNQAALVVDFHNGQAGHSVVFGYRWDGTASGEDMLKAIAAANTGLYATMFHFSFGDAVFGFGLDRNDGQLNLSPSLPTPFVSGVAMLPSSSDGNAARAAVDSADFYVEDPFVNGYWSYWTSTSIAGDWASSFVGAGDRTLANGDVDGWSYAVGFGDITPSDPVNPSMSPPLDSAPPDTDLTSDPPSFNNTSATFTYTGSDDVTSTANLTFEVSLDNSPFTAAGTSPTYTGLAQGPHTFRVRARDEAGNVDSTPASVAWSIHTTTDTAPTLAPVSAPATFAHTAAPPSITLSGNDADGDIANLQYDVKAFIDDATYRAQQVTQSKGLKDPKAPAPHLPFYENHRGFHEKYFVGTGNVWYYIMPTGDLFQYVSDTPTSIVGTKLATLDSSFWANPNKVLTAAAPDVSAIFTTVTSNGASGTVDLITTATANFAGTLHMVASVSDGVLATLTPRAFDVVVTNTAPTLAPVPPPAPFGHTASPPSINLSGNDADGAQDIANLEYSVKVFVDDATYRAQQVAQSKGLIDPKAPASKLPFYENTRGLHEKYFQDSANQWYYIMSTGDLFQYVSGTATSLVGNLLATLDSSFWADPSKVLTATADDVSDIFTTVTSSGTSGQVNLVPSAVANFAGTLHMLASVSDGTSATPTPRAFDVVVTDTAPTLAPVAAPAPFSHTTAPPSITLTGGDADGAMDIAKLQYSAQVYVDDAAYLAHQLTVSKGLADPKAPAGKLPFYQDTRHKNEKYFVGTGNVWYYILPNGDFYQYVSDTPTSIVGTYLGTLPTSYWANPNLVLTATPTDVSAAYVTVSGNGTTSGQLNFNAAAVQNFAGTLHIVASVSDGAKPTATPGAFDVVVTNTPPTLAPVTAPAPFSHTATPPSIALTGGDADGAADIANLEYSATVYVDDVTYRAYQLTQSKGLADPKAPAGKLPFYENTRGQHEKYLVGTGNIYYYILPDGSVYQYVASTTSTASTASALMTSQNDTNLWSNMMPSGTVQSSATSSGPGPLTGVLVATLNSSYWANPNLVLTAVPTDVASTYVTLSGNGTTNGLLNFITTATQVFQGTLHVTASVSDGMNATLTPRSFDVVIL